MTQLSTRAKIISTLERIQQGESLSSLLDPLLNSVNEADKGFTHELLLGTLRQWWALSRIGESLIEREVTDKGVWAGLNIGLYQLLYMDTPDYASIGETVEAVKQLDKGYGAGLINAILRKVQKNPAKFIKKIEKNHSLPNWLAKQLKADWNDHYAKLGQALRLPAPIFLRVNAKFCTLNEYTKLLDETGVGYAIEPLGVGDEATIRLTDNVKITALPHFADGWVSVQDRHAQLSAHILASLALDKPINLLDACTAPGGKLAHFLEVFHVEQLTHVTALDNDAKRLSRVSENLQRLQLMSDKVQDKVTLICDDATSVKADKPFDVIVLDAPCTATGVIRRHPDIALLRSENDVVQTVELQGKILANCWANLAEGGYLLYVTCSLLKAENEQQIERFLANHSNAQTIDFTLDLPNQLKRPVGYQCLPLNKNDGDGFFYSLLKKA
ncbi:MULTISPECIES: 16S rRNA (cytosine(967)-C(5))-methyltransferase RsmB [unclassified Moraxella]|uniref:16S rRNA (cytosine(967)-C(5))-methyltransferase RsmB n=1 Tax=unclassified Moraxella TaxID=2685852 RepID=UPI003AF4DC04